MEIAAESGPAVLTRPAIGRDEKFFFISAIVMAVVVVAGFGLNLVAGRSSFAVPARFHIHAVLFFGWTTLYVMQNVLAGKGSLALHRRLGWLAAFWAPAMVVSAIYTTAANVRIGRFPPVFQPAYFLVMNTLHILCFAGFVGAALLMRRKTQWHRRLMFIAMATLTAAAFGRLLPMPLFIPYTGWAVALASMTFLIAGAIRDQRKDGRVHPAWWWGIGYTLLFPVVVGLIANSALGLSIYEAVTSGSSAALPPYQFPFLQGGQG